MNNMFVFPSNACPGQCSIPSRIFMLIFSLQCSLPLGRSSYRREDNIKMDLTATACEGMDWTLRIRSNSGSCEHGNEPLGFTVEQLIDSQQRLAMCSLLVSLQSNIYLRHFRTDHYKKRLQKSLINSMVQSLLSAVQSNLADQ
jgi:hypothetical protein